MALPDHVQRWFIPLSEDKLTLRQASAAMKEIALEQNSIPIIVQLAENPKFELPGLEIFSGATDLETHDYIHLILGRGVMPKDEAFILGFTMGSTNRIGTLEENLYGLFAKFLYPKTYRFTKEDFKVYKDAVRLGYISACRPLNEVNYRDLLDMSLAEVRKSIGIEVDLLKAYYAIEKQRYLTEMESQRLLKGF